MAYPPCNPKLLLLSSANSPRALGMLPHLPLSPICEQEALAVQQWERHCQQNPDLWMSSGQTPHRSSKIQQFCPQPIHACGKWIRGQNTALPNTSQQLIIWCKCFLFTLSCHDYWWALYVKAVFCHFFLKKNCTDWYRVWELKTYCLI